MSNRYLVNLIIDKFAERNICGRTQRENYVLADVQSKFYFKLSQPLRNEFNQLENVIFKTQIAEQLELINFVIEFLKKINYLN